MSFATLAADAEYMKAQEADFLSPHADADLIDTYKAVAKDDLLDDLQEKLGLDPADADEMALIDDYIDDHADRMSRVLSIKCLVYWFKADSSGYGANLDKLDFYTAEYRRMKNGFPGLKQARGTSKVTAVRVRK